MIKFDFSTYTKDFISESDITKYEARRPQIDAYISNSSMMGWNNLGKLFNKDLVEDIKATASYVRNNCDVFLVIGIGGSYLGSLSAIESLKPYFYNNSINPQIYFVGNNLSSDYYHDLFNLIRDKRIIVNVISKSGATLETLISYNLVMNLMREKYSESELRDRIIITTDREEGTLRAEVNDKGYKSFVLPDDIGGRYSVFSPVGLLPIAVSNIDIERLYNGAKEANANIDNQIRYAIIRKLIHEKGKAVEAFVVYEPKLYNFTEWLKQLYSESLGKEGKGTLPIGLINVRDLHSMGQFIQQGTGLLFETVLNIEKSKNDIMIPAYNKSLNDINNIASISTSMAHLKGGILNNIITIDDLNEETLGYLFQFFMLSCAISGYFEEVNPFNQDGVEEYKNIMRDLLSADKN